MKSHATNGRMVVANIDDPLPGEEQQNTLLHLFARLGQLAKIEDFIARGTTIDREDKDGNAPLITAMESRQSEAACLLLEKGANPNKPTGVGLMPLDLAETLELESVVAALKERGGEKTDLPEEAFSSIVLTPATMRALTLLDDSIQSEWATLCESFAKTKDRSALIKLLILSRKHNIPTTDPDPAPIVRYTSAYQK